MAAKLEYGPTIELIKALILGGQLDPSHHKQIIKQLDYRTYLSIAGDNERLLQMYKKII